MIARFAQRAARSARRHIVRFSGVTLITGVAALVLATSVVCIMGLSSVNVAEVLSPAGQVWLTRLIEVGALALLVLAFNAGFGLWLDAVAWLPDLALLILMTLVVLGGL